MSTRPSTADTRLSTVPVIVVSRATFHTFFKQLREALGPSAEDVLYRCGLEAGQAFVGVLSEWTGSRDPVDIVDGLGDIYSRCGWFAVESVQVDPPSHQARLRLNRTLETYGVEGRWDVAGCHFLRGYIAGFFRSLFWSDETGCTEVSCRGKGDKVCEFVVTDAAVRSAPD